MTSHKTYVVEDGIERDIILDYVYHPAHKGSNNPDAWNFGPAEDDEIEFNPAYYIEGLGSPDISDEDSDRIKSEIRDELESIAEMNSERD